MISQLKALKMFSEMNEMESQYEDEETMLAAVNKSTTTWKFWGREWAFVEIIFICAIALFLTLIIMLIMFICFMCKKQEKV